jgi:hypothetical protein
MQCPTAMIRYFADEQVEIAPLREELLHADN